MQALPFLQQGIISVHQKGVIKLITQLLVQGTQAGEVDHKSTSIQLGGGKPEGETAAVAMHEPAMALMAPLPMATGIPLELFAAAEPGWWKGQGGGSRTLRED